MFAGLAGDYQEVILDITERMGKGMAEFIPKEVGCDLSKLPKTSSSSYSDTVYVQVMSIEDYDLYCHYVAGLVGEGLSALFAASGLEDPQIAQEKELANSMGLFLQKTNIIRDYLEDIMEEPAPRMFWPKEIWGKYAKKLDEFKEPENIDQAVCCLNAMITDALKRVPHVLQYLELLKDGCPVFKFCAIPQVMAIATLAECYNNPEVFKRVVKVRRGTTAVLTLKTTTMTAVYTTFQKYLRVIAEESATARIIAKDPTAEATMKAAEHAEDLCMKALHGLKSDGTTVIQAEGEQQIPMPVRIGVFFIFFMYACYAYNLDATRIALPGMFTGRRKAVPIPC
eukprot:scaffold201_cov405-Prasinococcus_capsulatus_cf.AAC.24